MVDFRKKHGVMSLLWVVVAGYFVASSVPVSAQTQASTETAPRPSRKITLNRAGTQESGMSLEEIRNELKKNPNNMALYYRAGFLEEQRGDLVQALRDYQEAIIGKNRVADAYYRSGIVWEKQGSFTILKISTARGVSSTKNNANVPSTPIGPPFVRVPTLPTPSTASALSI